MLRSTIPLTLVLCLVALFICHPNPVSRSAHAAPAGEPPGDSDNAILRLSVIEGDGNSYKVRIDYRYQGGLKKPALRAYALEYEDGRILKKLPWGQPIVPGRHTALVPLFHDYYKHARHATRFVRVELYDHIDNRVARTRNFEYPIDWPEIPYFKFQSGDDADKTDERLYREAVAEIDFSSPDSLSNARKKLDLLLTRDPGFVPVYPELARYHMKSNWSPKGLKQAEQALLSGLAIDPDHADSHVLIGYVYAHQGRHEEAEAAFGKARGLGTDNLWLWTNWGESLLMQGKLAEAVEKYKEATDGSRPYNDNDRARKIAYRNMLKIYSITRAFEAADALHLKRVAEYPIETCFPYEYAQFRQLYFDDADTVLAYAGKSLDAGCDREADIRKVTGVAYYAKWLAADEQAERRSALVHARLQFPEGPELLYRLARSETTLPVLEKLLDEGTDIDITDSDGLTALAFALQKDDLDAIKRLVELGANPDMKILASGLPILAIAIMNRNQEALVWLVDHGADVDSPVYGGGSLRDLAERMGHTELLQVLERPAAKGI